MHMVNQREIFLYFKFSKNQVGQDNWLYLNILVFKPGKDMLPEFRWKFTKEE